MKVLHTLDSLNRGGAETLVLDICRNAADFGIDLMFVATGGGDLEADFKNSGVSYIRLDRDYPLDPGLVRRMRDIIKETGAEIVQCYQPVEALHLYFATIGLDVKRVFNHQGGGTSMSRGKNKYAARILTPRMDANIACSKGMYPWLRDEVGLDISKNFYLVHNGVDIKRLEPSGSSFKDELGLPENNLLIGMVANFVPTDSKDQMTVCRALPEILNSVENTNFVFVGRVAEGSERYFDDCVKYCADNGIGEKVFFVGKRDDVPDILNALDLFVFSTLKEGLPISLVEAMLVGVPVVATDIEPILETTDNGSCIETFTPKDAGELSRKAIKLLNDKDLRYKLSKQAYKYAKENFGIESHLRSLNTLYTEILGQNPTGEQPTGNEK